MVCGFTIRRPHGTFLNPFAYARRRRATAYAGTQRDFIQIALGVGSVLFPGRAGMLKQGPRGFPDAVRAVQEGWRRTSAEVPALERESLFAEAGRSRALRC